MKTKISLILIITFILLSNFLQSQEMENNYKFNIVGFDGLLSVPQGIFGRNMKNKVIPGVNFNYLKQYKVDQPFFLGGGIGFGNLATSADQIIRVNPSSIDEIWDGRTNSNLLKFYGSARYFINLGGKKLTPYFQANLGWNWFYTITSFTFPDSDESSTDFEKSEISFMYSGALGANYAMDYNWHINLSVGFENGQSAFYYVDRDEYQRPQFSPVENLELKKSLTNSIAIQLGAAYRW
jgi:hypothetical protein